MLWPKLQCPLVALRGVRITAQRQQGIAAVVPGVDRTRIEPERPVTGVYGSLRVAKLEQSARQVGVGVRLAGVDCDGAPDQRGSLGDRSGLDCGSAEQVERVERTRHHREDLTIGLRGHGHVAALVGCNRTGQLGLLRRIQARGPDPETVLLPAQSVSWHHDQIVGRTPVRRPGAAA